MVIDVEQNKNRLFREQAELASSRGGAGINTIHPGSAGNRDAAPSTAPGGGGSNDLPLVDVVRNVNGGGGSTNDDDDNPHEAGN